MRPFFFSLALGLCTVIPALAHEGEDHAAAPGTESVAGAITGPIEVSEVAQRNLGLTVAEAYTWWETDYYVSPAVARQGDDWFGTFLLLFLLWSTYASYRGVRTVFNTRKWAARCWFAILPLMLYGIAIGLWITVFLNAGLFANRPDLEQTHTFRGPNYSLDYPGNWLTNEKDPDTDPVQRIRVSAPLEVAIVAFYFYDEAGSSSSVPGQRSHSEEVARMRIQEFSSDLPCILRSLSQIVVA